MSSNVLSISDSIQVYRMSEVPRAALHLRFTLSGVRWLAPMCSHRTRSRSMTTESPLPTTEEPSRRDLVAVAVTVAAAAGAASGAAQAQGKADVRYSNPPGMSSPPAYSHVVEVNGPHRTVYLAGQTEVDATVEVAASYRAQAQQELAQLNTT